LLFVVVVVVVVVVLASSSSKKTFSLNFSASLFVFDDDSAEAITLFRFSARAAASAAFSFKTSSSDEALNTRKARRLLPRTSATVDDVFSFSVVKSSLLLVIVVLARRRSEEEEKEEEYISNKSVLFPSASYFFAYFSVVYARKRVFMYLILTIFGVTRERENVRVERLFRKENTSRTVQSSIITIIITRFCKSSRYLRSPPRTGRNRLQTRLRNRLRPKKSSRPRRGRIRRRSRRGRVRPTLFW